MGKWTITPGNGTLDVKVIGSMTPQNAKDYYNEFLAASKKVNPPTCKLSLDGSELAVSESDSAQILQSILKLYKDLGFQDVTINFGHNAVLEMQVKMLANKVGFRNFKVI